MPLQIPSFPKPNLVCFGLPFHLRLHMAAVTASSIKCQHQSETSMQLKFPRASFDSFAPFRGDVYDAHTFNHNVNYPARPQAALTWIPSPLKLGPTFLHQVLSPVEAVSLRWLDFSFQAPLSALSISSPSHKLPTKTGRYPVVFRYEIVKSGVTWLLTAIIPGCRRYQLYPNLLVKLSALRVSSLNRSGRL